MLYYFLYKLKLIKKIIKMGASWNSTIEKGEVLESIKQINEITKKHAVIEFIYLQLEFSLDEDTPSKKRIKVKVKHFNYNEQKLESKEKTVKITLDQFYNYYNSLMNSLSIFLEKKLERKYSFMCEEERSSLGSEDSSFCPICEENKIDISLPCSHFFCESCIKAWIIKSKTCPLCRLNLQYNNNYQTPAGIRGSGRWLLITKDEKMNEEIKKDSVDIFLKLTQELFNS